MPLILGLRMNESVWIGDNITVEVVGTGTEVKLSINAPRDINIVRHELKERAESREEPQRAKS